MDFCGFVLVAGKGSGRVDKLFWSYLVFHFGHCHSFPSFSWSLAGMHLLSGSPIQNFALVVSASQFLSVKT